MKSYKLNLALVSGVAAATLSLPAFAGSEIVESAQSDQAVNNGSFAEWLTSSPGQLYKNKNNPYLQGVKLFGRIHYQAVHADVNPLTGSNISGVEQEFRRVRAGAQIDFLKYFKLKGTVNLETDDRPVNGDLDFGYDSVEDATLTFDAGKAFNLGYFDSAKVIFGKQKIAVGGEQHYSSKKIKTIERSAISNTVRPANSTGLSIAVSKDAWSGSLGYFSNENVQELSYDFDSEDGDFFYATVSYDVNENDTLTLDYVKNNGTESGAGSFDLDYAFSASYEMERGPYNLLLNGFYGNNGDVGSNNDRGGDFHGFVILPSYEINDKLEAVFRYQYQASNEENAIRVNSRYTRRPDTSLGNSGRGDLHQSVYAGLVYKFIGHNLKVLGGVEYDYLESGDNDAESVTVGGAVRFFF